jgi:antitoxin ParD1/3/4
MSKTTSFILGSHFDEFVNSQVTGGRYASVSEVIREGLRLVEERTHALNVLKSELDAGVASGVAEDFSWDDVRRRGSASN